MSAQTISLIVGMLFGSTGAITWFLGWLGSRKTQKFNNELALNAQNLELTKVTVETLATANKILNEQLSKAYKRIEELEEPKRA